MYVFDHEAMRIFVFIALFLPVLLLCYSAVLAFFFLEPNRCEAS